MLSKRKKLLFEDWKLINGYKQGLPLKTETNSKFLSFSWKQIQQCSTETKRSIL
jgi:hypothetical protein